MNSNFDYRKFAIMYVDDEAQTISNFKAYFSDTFDVVIASSGEEAWKLFSENQDRFAIVMTDQRMPSSTGVELLEKVRAARPRVIRILATAYSDLDAAIAAVNEGAIYKYVPKPWDPPILEMLLKRALEFFLVQRELDSLMKEKMAAMQRLMMTDRLLSLGIFAAGLNHHIRNSLTAIKTFLDLAPFQLQQENVNIERLRNPNYWRDFYETVQSQMCKIVTLLSDINEIPEPAGVPLADTVVIDDVILNACETNRGAFNAKGIDLDFVAGKVPAIGGNRSLIDKGLSLLLADELANVPEGGKITVKTTLAKDESGEDGVRIDVIDNGPGLSADNVNCIFDPFFVRRDNPAEYGLNLLTCFFIVYHHSGTMSVSQSAEGGAQFEIFLPLQPNNQSPKQAQAYLGRIFELEKAWEKMLVGY
jgi:two-component system, probable response regulator PhcQ